MKKIMVPTDFSACSNAAADFAIRLAQQLKAEVFYLNLCQETVTISHIPGGQHELPSEEIKNARSELAKLVTKTERQGVKATQILVFDNGVDSIENYVNPYGIEMVLMGSHCANGIKEFVLGSNTQQVINHVHVPVLVIKEGARFSEPKNILFLSDFSLIPFKEFAIVADIARTFQANVHIVFVNLIHNPIPFEDAHNKMKQLTANYTQLKFSYNVAETNDEEYAIMQFSNKLDADFIAIAISEKSVYANFASHRGVEHLLSHEQKPVLVLKS